MTISSGTFQSGDTLNFINQNGITGSYSGGVLTLSGNATVAQYQTALQSVAFSTTSTNTTARAISFVALDEALASNVAVDQVDVSTTLPALTASGTTNTFTVGESAVAVDSGLTGSPSASDLTGATATISSGTFQSGDMLSFTNQNGITSSYSGGVLTLTGDATVAQYQAALRSLMFSTTSTIGTNRTISVVAVDGTLDSSPAIEQVNVLLVPPVVTASGTTNAYLVGSAGVAVDLGLTISPYDVDLTGATVTISSATLQPGDVLNFTNQNGISGVYSGGVLTLSGNATIVQYQAALRSVTFSSTSTSLASRSIAIVAIDSTLVSNVAAESVSVVRSLVTPSGSVVTYTDGASAVYTDSGITVSSADSTLSGAVATISAGTLGAGDLLSFTSPAGSGITSAYAGGVLTLSGIATVAQYQAALRSVMFSNVTNASVAARSISIVTIDGGLASNRAAEQVNVVAPAMITGVYVKGASWSMIDSYFNSHGLGTTALGYALKTGSSELIDLPWNSITTVSVVFSQPVNVAGGVNVAVNSMELIGGTGAGSSAVPSVSSFTTSGNTATWVFSGALGENQYVLAVASTNSSFGAPVTDANGAGLDGDFTKSVSSFPSGNGLAGGGFNFFFNILPGDSNQASVVSAASLSPIHASSNKSYISAGYSPYADVDASGVVNATDVSVAAKVVNRTLATLTAPLAPAVVVVGTPSFTNLALSVLDTSSSSTDSTTSAISNDIIPASNSSAITAPAASNSASIGSVASTGSGDLKSTLTNRGQHGRHQFAATDAALSDFDLADLQIAWS